MQPNKADPTPVDRAAVARREVLTFWAFAAFLLAGVIALGIDAVIKYA